MKISASIYSDKKRPLKEVIRDLVDHQVDILHVDCNDDLTVFDDIRNIRSWCSLPIDLHIITEDPRKYMDLLISYPVEYVTFQLEPLKYPLVFPNEITGKKGLAIVTPTSIDQFDAYASEMDFVLLMATVPGQSGGVFDSLNFSKIRSFQRKYPSKSIHVDGGVNGEVSFILRNMGVSSSVSGSYLFNEASVGQALMNLTKRNLESQFLVRDFMIPLSECPVISESELTFESVLTVVENGKLGFCIVLGESNRFIGLISNADIRRGLLRNLKQLNDFSVNDFVNTNVVGLEDTFTVNRMLQELKLHDFPISYFPVWDKDKISVGIITFVNLIKGEL